ncbi:MAG: hypothetical protein ACFCBW_09965 [Candidatus Competibacterales bacterium]
MEQPREYLLKVSADAQPAVVEMLKLSSSPEFVRLSTLATLSNYGYTQGSEGCVLSIDERGVVFGVEGDESIPRAFVPWQNVSYIADGTSLAASRQPSAGLG